MALVALVIAPLFLCACVLLVYRSWSGSGTVKTPTPLGHGLRRVPGPPGLPVIGNTLQLKPQPQRQLQAWASQYGELFQIQLGWYNWVFVNSPAAVKDIFDKQSAVTSGRVPMPVGSDLISGGKRFLLMSYTPEWRKLRAIVHKLLTPKSSEQFRPSQEFEAKQLIRDIWDDNRRGDHESFYMHIRRYTTSVVMTSTYGRRIPQWNCEDVREVYGLMKEFSDATAPGVFIADTLPPLADVVPQPLQWWRRQALQYYNRQARIWMKYWTILQEQIRQGVAPDCFVRQWSEGDYKKQGISEIQAAFVAGTMIEAGSETTSSALNSAVLYLAAYPEVQARAHAEFSRTIGDHRSPTFDDEPSLPYIRAMVKEILRLRPVTNIGTPHFTTADVVYKDYLIPKGTVVAVNQYALHYDPRRYDRPDDFIPDRYLHHPLKAGAYAAHPDPLQRDHFGFGAGRRICPGMHLAENSLFITLAKILWAFHVKPCLRPDGGEEVLDVSDDAYENGANTLPKPFRVRFVPRNKVVEATLVREWSQAEAEGYYLGNVKVKDDAHTQGQR
ncbi:hypothetical protein A1O3_03733 [Capronia epimyces CBS 606.96]|uniref:O-methylsterigmatocystin oxidoreductase n=1 Tax=Capronia epimyces CBS 606.96 TaxID=1182542 RepID=W9YWW7_9EURO|nr:uncharacterized protein A1O3_03733 [Capronia epimyces CBS 606.96]EXJ86779.1 hypothetical protein A1O3_03733 [Capronia epimyces CBS 606.96]